MFFHGNIELFHRLISYWGLQSEVDYIGFCTSCSEESDKKHSCSHPLTTAGVMVRACHNLDEAATVLASSLQACCVNRELNNLQEGTVYKGRK